MVKTHYGWLTITILSTLLVMCFAVICIYIGGATAIYADGFFFAMVCSILPIYPVSVAFSVVIGGLNIGMSKLHIGTVKEEYAAVHVADQAVATDLPTPKSAVTFIAINAVAVTISLLSIVLAVIGCMMAV